MMARLLSLLLLGVVLGACGGTSDPDQAEITYGTLVDATEALPAPAVAGEDSLYVGHRVTVDGRITAVRKNGCEVHLSTDAAPLVVKTVRADAGDCAWQVPQDALGFAVASGTLRVADDTLRLSADGVRVTPIRFSNPDS
jgi:hypothetical protein